jgi:vacuolar protein sorting-associated protein 35
MYIAAVARLQPSVNVQQIVIALIDRFSSFATRAKEGETSSGIPNDLALFDVFWEQVTELMEARPEFTIEDIASLLLSSGRMALNCYPERLDYIDRVLGMAQAKIFDARQKDPYFKLMLGTPRGWQIQKNILKNFFSVRSMHTNTTY